MMRCPYCHAGIETREEGVRCARCQAPHHQACWTEYGKCCVYGCGATENKLLGKLGTARIAIAAGRNAVKLALVGARERLGGKSVVALFALSCAVPGLGIPFLYHTHASPKVDLEFVLGGLFLVLATWITALLYRGSHLTDDVALKVGERGLGSYYFFMSSGSGSGARSGCGNPGCGDVGGCSGGSGGADEILGAIVVAVLAVAVVVVVLPFVAWLAVEVLYPCVVLAVYFALYGALAFAVNDQQDLAGKLFPCLARALRYAFLYTSVVAALILVAVRLFHAFAPAH